MQATALPATAERAPKWRRPCDWAIVALLVGVGLSGWLAPGLLASPRLEMVPELSIIWMAKQRILEGGLLTEWVPYEFSGFPLVRFLSYPLYDALALISISTGLALESLYKAGVIAAFVLSGVTLYELAHALTKSRGASIAAGIIYALFPFHLLVASEAWVHAVFWAVMPLVFLAYERSRESGAPSARGGLLMGVLVAALPIINTEYTLLFAPFLGAYVLARELRLVFRDRVDWVPLVAYWTLAALVAVGLSAFFVVPGILELEYVGIHLKHGAESYQSDELLRGYAVSPPLVLRAFARRLGIGYELAEAPVIASAFWSITWYPGLAALALAALGIWRGRRDPRLQAILILLCLSVLFVVGSWLPGNPVPHLPYLGRLAPFRSMVFVGFALAICAAYGARELLRRPSRPLVAWSLAAIITAAIMVDYAPATRALRSVPSYRPADEIAAYRWMAFEGGDARSWEYMSAHRDAYLRSYVLAYDNHLHAWGYYDNGAPRHMWALYSWGDLPTALSLSNTRYVINRPSRPVSAEDERLLYGVIRAAFPIDAWTSESLTIWENPEPPEMVHAYATNALYLGDPEYRALDVLPVLAEQGVALVSGRSDYADDYAESEIAAFDHVIVREPWVREGGRGNALASVLSDRATTHGDLLAQPPAWQVEAADPPAQLSWSRPGPERIEVRVRAHEETTLMVSEAWYPNWRLTIDGEEQPVWRVNYAFLGALVSPGEHTLVFRYEMPWYVWGSKAISALTLLGLCVAFARWPRPSRLPLPGMPAELGIEERR